LKRQAELFVLILALTAAGGRCFPGVGRRSIAPRDAVPAEDKTKSSPGASLDPSLIRAQYYHTPAIRQNAPARVDIAARLCYKAGF